MIKMQRLYYYIDGRRGISDFVYEGPMELFTSAEEAFAVEAQRRQERIAELKAGLARLDADA